MAAPKDKNLEKEDHTRDAAFNKIMHGNSAAATGGIRAMLNKGGVDDAKKAAVDEYFKHWDKKTAKDETDEDRATRTAEYATLTRQYVDHFTTLDACREFDLLLIVIIILLPISMNMDGASPFTSADSLTENLFTKPSRDTNTTSLIWLASKKA